jgi:ketosteroid isomerase-like protein
LADPAAPEAEAFVSAFARTWAYPRADEFAAMFQPEIRLVAPLLPVTTGVEESVAAIEAILAAFDGLHGRVHAWAPHPDGVFIDFTLSGALGGRPVGWRGVDRFLLRDGLATERVHYSDSLTLLRAAARAPRAWPALARTRARPRPPFVSEVPPASPPAALFVRAYATALAQPTPARLRELVAGGDEPFSPLLELLPDLRATILRWGERDGALFVESRYSATVAGQPMEWEGVDRFAMADGRARSARSYFDHGALAGRAARSPREWPRWLAAHRRARSR